MQGGGNQGIDSSGGVRSFAGMRWRAQMLSSAFIISDFLSILVSYLLAYLIYESWLLDTVRRRDNWDPSFFLLLGCGMGILTVLAFGWLGLYSRRVSVLNVQEDVMLLKGLIFNAVTALAVSYLLHTYPLSRIALVLSLLLIAPLIVIGRRLIRGVSSWFVAAGIGTQPVLIYGAGDAGGLLAYRTIENAHLGMKPVGFIDDALEQGAGVHFGPAKRHHLPVLGGHDEMVDLARQHKVESILIAIPKLATARLSEIQECCRVSGLSCFHIPLHATGPLRRLSLTFIGDIPLVYERVLTQNFARRVLKRLIDIVLSALLLFISIPFMVIAVIGVLFGSQGAVIFRQQRVGIYGKLFIIYKFRTMHVRPPDPAPGQFPAAAIFPWGRILRKSSIDELPQLWNVLKGDMSLVGPRPEMPEIVAEYNQAQRERLNVLPGLTGLWQVSGDRNLPIHENIDYDLYYIYNQSLLLDLVILIRTFFCLFTGR